MSANFRFDGKVDKLIDLFTSINKKGEKNPTFYFEIFVKMYSSYCGTGK